MNAPLLLALLAPLGIDSEGERLMADLHRQCGPSDWSTLQQIEDWDGFASALEREATWLREILDSGPVRQPERVLTFLHGLWQGDPDLHQRPIDRSMATACALAFGMTNVKTEVMSARFEYYRDSHAAGLLNSCYAGLSTWERRFLARGCQWGFLAETQSLTFLRDTITWPRAQYTNACWQAPYRSFNCLGDTVQGPEYYRPFRGSFVAAPQMVITVGGVCGALSNLGASAAMANGIPAATMGEPGHCAYTVKIDEETWQPAYSLSWKRSLHTSFYSASWPGLMLTEACYSDEAAMAKSSDLARRAHAEEAAGDLDRAGWLWKQALKAHGLNFNLWEEWAAYGERTNQGPEWWNIFHDALLEGLGEHEEPTWSLLSRHVYPRLLKGLDTPARHKLFMDWVRELKTWGGGRWNIEGAWNWMLKELATDHHAELVRSIGDEVLDSSDFGPPYVSWLLARYSPESPEWDSILSGIVKASRTGEEGHAALRQLARKTLPDAAERGDVRTFQAIGKAAARLSQPQSMEGLEPFEGELLSEGGLLHVSGRGNRWDSPEHHWGVLGEYGGACHTGNGKSFIAVRLEHHAKLAGIVIQNRKGGNMWRAGGSRVEISTDGKDWQQIGTLEGTKPIYRIDLTDKDHSATWVRIIKDTNCLHLRRFLVYGQRRS
jgi:hypothetical protein